jgi:lipooligosaccharide transport system permease protein
VSASMTGAAIAKLTPAGGPRRAPGAGAGALIERNVLVYRRMWPLLVSGLFEPVFYLFSIGVGVGSLIGKVALPDGTLIDYRVFVAPALFASAAMNGAIYDATFNIFFKLKYAKIYDAVLSTPMSTADVAIGEICWSLLRGLIYAGSFLVLMVSMGLALSWWVVFALPAATLVGFAFGAAGMAGTTFVRSWRDFEWLQLIMLPMFLFATTFYPVTVYSRPLQIFVECTPLYHAIELIRGLSLGRVGVGLLGHAAYLAVMGLLGLLITAKRLDRLLLT